MLTHVYRRRTPAVGSRAKLSVISNLSVNLLTPTAKEKAESVLILESSVFYLGNAFHGWVGDCCDAFSQRNYLICNSLLWFANLLAQQFQGNEAQHDSIVELATISTLTALLEVTVNCYSRCVSSPVSFRFLFLRL